MNCYTDCYLISMTTVFHASVFRVHLFANKYIFTLLLQKKHIDFAQIAKILSDHYHSIFPQLTYTCHLNDMCFKDVRTLLLDIEANVNNITELHTITYG